MEHNLEIMFSGILGRPADVMVNKISENFYTVCIKALPGENLDVDLDWLRGNEESIGVLHPDGRFFLLGDGDDNGAVIVKDGYAVVWVRHLDY